jgi:hypothetical protein
MAFKSHAQRRAVFARLSGVKLRRLARHEYEFQVGAYDYHVQQDGRSWVLNQFESRIKNADDAHRGTIECESLHDAVLYAKEEA